MTALVVALGGALGAAVRYLVGRALATAHFPWGTLVVNVGGCLLLGLVVTATDGTTRQLLGTGVAGSLTTYSAFALDTVLLDRNGHRGRALANVGVNLALGLVAFALGWWVGGAA